MNAAKHFSKQHRDTLVCLWNKRLWIESTPDKSNGFPILSKSYCHRYRWSNYLQSVTPAYIYHHLNSHALDYWFSLIKRGLKGISNYIDLIVHKSCDINDFIIPQISHSQKDKHKYIEGTNHILFVALFSYILQIMFFTILTLHKFSMAGGAVDIFEQVPQYLEWLMRRWNLFVTSRRWLPVCGIIIHVCSYTFTF